MRVLKRFYRDGVPGPAHLLFEGAFAAVLGILFAAGLFPREASLFSVFLVSLSAHDSMERILNWNRWAIVKRGRPPAEANLRLILLLASIFTGTTIGWSAMGLTLAPNQVRALFSHQVSVQRVLFPDIYFGDFISIFQHNLFVMLFFFIIALPFRRGGVMLAIAWNASVWGATFGVMAREWASAEGLRLISTWPRVMAAVVPHMTLEATAYVLAGLAGVFWSRGIERHDLTSESLGNVTKVVTVMMVIGAVLVALGAAVEAHIAPVLVALVSGGSGG